MNIVIPASGGGSRFANAGYQHPKPFIPIRGKSMIEHVIDNLASPNDKVYVLLLTHALARLSETNIPFRKNVSIIPISEITEGAACTVLRARSFIDNAEPLVIANCDQYVKYDHRAWEFFTLERRAGLMVFHAPPGDTRWSFVRLNPEGEVEEVAEKKPISNVATVGVYFFSAGYLYCHAADTMIAADDRTNGEFYVAPVYNYLQTQKHPFYVEEMYGLGDPELFAKNYERIGT